MRFLAAIPSSALVSIPPLLAKRRLLRHCVPYMANLRIPCTNLSSATTPPFPTIFPCLPACLPRRFKCSTCESRPCGCNGDLFRMRASPLSIVHICRRDVRRRLLLCCRSLQHRLEDDLLTDCSRNSGFCTCLITLPVLACPSSKHSRCAWKAARLPEAKRQYRTFTRDAILYTYLPPCSGTRIERQRPRTGLAGRRLQPTINKDGAS